MEPRHKDAIQRNFTSLLAQTDLNVMVSALYEKGVFTEQMIEQYKNVNKESKRNFYFHLMRRGPNAFRHLLDTLWEIGLWSLVRELDPDGEFHQYSSNSHNTKTEANDESSYISIREERKQKENNRRNDTQPQAPVQPAPTIAPSPAPVFADPPFEVKKSTKFIDDDGKGFQVYPMSGGLRVMLIFTYNEFKSNIEDKRPGADIDCHNLKYLFKELDFKVLAYPNLTYKETLARLEGMACSLAGAECVFVVVSSHGYARPGSVDIDFRVSDGGLMSFQRFVDYFNNNALPNLHKVPKVFIFQTCRGSKEDMPPLPKHISLPEPDGTCAADTPDAVPDGRPGRAAAAAPAHSSRVYSDILIAHSTVPGYVSRRNPDKGSWYIQTLCDVFAEKAADHHVEELFTLVDIRMDQMHKYQTSSVDKWGFNKRLYLHPGLNHRDRTQ
ncbi:caspase Dronc isoform X2 [Achroia grisella]|uniref:caspase Dronc isoform X2 n=1 Tax=Achroia grisella TaxID=688607 RepID=UPI0027D26E7E|nr:caspase Dronc isoform X2 [Achroia grisella]